MRLESSHRNHLIDESSPYLQQHATNPVDWHPWGEEALALARETDKPVLLSIGYSACHWCHVMAHESFEDEATGKLMNDLFVNIKVDREERPDLDKIYQTAHQLLTQRGGGWPLTMFINPEDQRPFFGGTYFPDEARYGMPSFRDLLIRVALYYTDNRDQVRIQGEELQGVFSQLEPGAMGESQVLTDAPLKNAREKIAATMDREYGGFGDSPKFPHASSLDRLLRDWRDSAHADEPYIDALFLVSLTLTRMAEGGIYDQLGGGFCRYSVDRFWQIPHFEKMLYDNGPLLALYAQLYIATGEPLFRRIANETADWMQDDMVSENGGFYSTRDADSEGEEGVFYTWTPEQVKALLADDAYEVFASRFGLKGDANFEGKWHLSVRESIEDMVKSTGDAVSAVVSTIDDARQVLLREREKRVHPDRDEKQLTSWNALAIRGFAIAGRVLDRPDLIDQAAAAIDFISSEMMVNGRLLASYKDGESRLPAYLDDHAFLLDALLELLQSRWSSSHMAFAIDLAELLLKHFYDTANGGFYFTADDHEQLMHRPKPYADDATPSGNGIAVFALQRLGFILGETRYLDAAEKTLRSAWRAMDEYPHGHVSLLTALEEYTRHPEVIVIRGASAEIASWRGSAAKMYAPRRLVFAIDADMDELPGALAERVPLAGETIAYRCVGTHCSLPLNSWEALAAEMSESQAN
jgi:uncharacterized protein YyaL (SSP411 family)